MKFGTYWEQDQVRIASVNSSTQIPDDVYGTTPGTPAFLAIITGQTAAHHVFVEIIPGSQQNEHYLNLNTAQFEYGPCATVRVWEGPTPKFEDMKMTGIDSWPLEWFKLKSIPCDHSAHSAYDRAMSIVGG